jgi:glucose-specific phosphotransferase system IIA component
VTVIASPLTGTVVALDDVRDEVFAERVMGNGAAVLPTDGKVVAPLDGSIAKLFQGGHGFAIENDAGLQVLVHVGIDTVHLKGEGFTVHAKEGDDVKAGDHIVTVNLQKMTEKNIDMTSPVVVISGESSTIIADKEVAAGDVLLSVE